MSMMFMDDESTVTQPRDAIDTYYYPVSLPKFVLLSFASFGLYQLYWFYRNWCFVQRRDSPDIWPIGRAFFAPLFCHSLLRRIDISRGPASSLDETAWILTGAYIVTSFASRFADPWWLLSFFSFVPLIPAVMVINGMNDPLHSELERNSRWRLRHIALVVVGGFVTVMMIGGTVGYFPHPRVAAGSELWAKDIRFLTSNNLLDDGEELLYFYSPGFFSIHGYGSLLTDRRVATYWEDFDTGALQRSEVRLDEIESLEVISPEAWYEETGVIVMSEDGVFVWLPLSTEAGGDEDFVGELRARRR